MTLGVGGRFAEKQQTSRLPQHVDTYGPGTVATEIVLVVDIVSQPHAVIEHRGRRRETQHEVAMAELHMPATHPFVANPRPEGRHTDIAAKADSGGDTLLPPFLIEWADSLNATGVTHRRTACQ